MTLNPLYHWSPAERYESIRKHGLHPQSDPVVASTKLSYLCLSPDPRAAWSISGAMDFVNDIEYWDLWQIYIANTDELHVRPEFGPYILEVNLRGSVPPDRLWWIGRRYDLGIPGLAQDVSRSASVGTP